MLGEHERWLAVLAVLVAGIATFIPLKLAIRDWRSGRRTLRNWVTAAALSAITGLFTLQLLGMLALDLPIQTSYEVPVTLLALVLAVAVCGFALHAQAGELRHSEGAYRQLVELSPDGICVETGGRITFVNSAALKLLNAESADQIVGQRLIDLLQVGAGARGAAGPRPAAGLRALLDQRNFASPLEQKLLRLDGSAVDVEMVASPLGRGGDSSQIVLRDITERKKAEERLNHLAKYDPLTGLPNRTLFRDRFTHAVARATRNEALMALLLLDIDHFKEINDTLGHTTGDKVLQSLSTVLKGCIRDTDTLARLAGDEFSVIVESAKHVDDAVVVADKIISALSKPLIVDGQEIFATMSIGIAVYPFAGETIEQLLQAADVALYRVKEEGRNGYQFYAVDMNADAAEKMKIENLLRRAVEREEFSVHYQPKVDVVSGRISGLEALLRWHSPELGVITPDQFIPLAEKTGLIVPIGEWILRAACAQAKAWQDRGYPPAVMSVNLSARQFRQTNLVEMISNVLQETGLAPQYLELEITESLMMAQKDHAINVLEELHALGVQLSVDDFGTGYSSLSYLKRFPVQKLKVDKSFVRDATTDADDSAIVAAVVALGQSMSMSVVAEGVETAEQLKLLGDLGCNEYQGYHFSRPLPAEEVERLFAAPPEALAIIARTSE